jgi:hypothetical protein
MNHDALEILRFLAETHRRLFDERRRIESQILLASLGFYVVTVGAVYAKDLKLGEAARFFLIGAYALLALVTTVFLGHVHMANNKNKTVAEKAEGALLELARTGFAAADIFSPGRHWTSWSSFWGHQSRWSWVWQSFALALFAATASVLLYLAPSR